jgi:hypothetical protein
MHIPADLVSGFEIREAGNEILRRATDGEIREITYVSPWPGETDALTKVSYITRVGDIVCAVGYYH